MPAWVKRRGEVGVVERLLRQQEHARVLAAQVFGGVEGQTECLAGDDVALDLVVDRRLGHPHDLAVRVDLAMPWDRGEVLHAPW